MKSRGGKKKNTVVNVNLSMKKRNCTSLKKYQL